MEVAATEAGEATVVVDTAAVAPAGEAVAADTLVDIVAAMAEAMVADTAAAEENMVEAGVARYPSSS